MNGKWSLKGCQCLLNDGSLKRSPTLSVHAHKHHSSASIPWSEGVVQWKTQHRGDKQGRQCHRLNLLSYEIVLSFQKKSWMDDLFHIRWIKIKQTPADRQLKFSNLKRYLCTWNCWCCLVRHPSLSDNGVPSLWRSDTFSLPLSNGDSELLIWNDSCKDISLLSRGGTSSSSTELLLLMRSDLHCS